MSTSALYIIKIDTGNPDEDLDAAMRRAVEFMSNDIDDTGGFALEIVVTDAVGNFVTSHDYDPEEEVLA